MLPASPNVTWEESWRGRLSTAGGDAGIRVQVRSARMELPVSRRSGAGALRTNAFLPSNVRFAGPPDDPCLCADAWLPQEAFLASVHAFRVGVRKRGSRRRAWRPREAAPTDTHSSVIESLASSPEIDVVPRGGGWELGARVRGQRVAVRVSPESADLRLHRIVIDRARLEGRGPKPTTSVYDAALRLNARTRFARFAEHERGLAVETRLPLELLDADRLVACAHAVAVVSRELGPMLELLCQNPGVATCYARIFHPETEGA